MTEADGTCMGGGPWPDDEIPNQKPELSEFDTKYNAEQDSPSCPRTFFKTKPLSMPWLAKSTHAAASLSRWAFVVSICFSASQQLDQCQGSFTAGIYFDSVIHKHSLLGALNAQMRQM